MGCLAGYPERVGDVLPIHACTKCSLDLPKF
jgi:hypothetical protein